jgi:ATP phosphoribosyltransferase
MITVALAKGALLKDSVARLAAAGLDFAAVLEPGNRLLMVPSRCGQASALLVRNADVPVYVAYGQAQLGVVGYDVLQELQLPVAPLVDLGFGGCRMSVAVKASSGYRRAADLPAHCRVASKFTRCAEDYFRKLDLPVELIHLAGSVELGPITGMSEAIVDLVATGRTLQENGLVAIEDLFHSTARLIGHPLALRLDDGPLRQIVDRIAAATAIAATATATANAATATTATAANTAASSTTATASTTAPVANSAAPAVAPSVAPQATVATASSAAAGGAADLVAAT